MLSKNEEMVKIRRGKMLWQFVRRKRRVLIMMARMGETVIFDLDKNRIKEREDKEDEHSSKMSRFIIQPDNYWKMQWNNLILFVFIFWIFLMPVKVS
jgi:hypothetical protein